MTEIKPFERTDDDCPGTGKCHGSAGWCDRCGDVDDVCDAPVCYRHRCRYCSKIFSFGEREFLYEANQSMGDGYCFDCFVRVAVLDACDRGEDDIAAMVDADRKIARYRTMDQGRSK